MPPADTERSTDRALAEALVAGEPAAAVAAWRRYRPLVMRILRSRVTSGDLADDVAQEVFAHFFISVRKLRDPLALRAFVITLATRTLASELRRRRRRQLIYAEAAVCEVGARGELADAFSRHAACRLQRLLTQMRERERRVLLMCLVEHRHVDEVAVLLGLSAPTIRRALARARRRIATWSESDPFLCEFAAAPVAAR